MIVASLAFSCTSDIEPLTPAQREAVAAYVSKTPPSPEHAVEVELGRRVKLLGYDAEPDIWRRGQTIRVTWHWQVNAPPGEGWKLFTHIEDAASSRVLNQDGNGNLRWLYGPEHWRAGQYIRDAQELHLPDDWEGNVANVYVGLFRGEERMPVGGSLPSEDGRVLVAAIPVAGRSAERTDAALLPRLAVVQTRRPPRLDGALQDPEWTVAHTTRELVETRHGGAAPVRATAKLLWDARYLYVGVDVKDELLTATDTEHDSHLWEQDCVELMFDPDGDGRNYFEIQVSPRGVVFDTRYDARRLPRPFGRVEWDSRARVGVSLMGGLDDARADAGYSVEIAIPWQAFSLEGTRFSRPEVGDRWRANLYVMDRTRDRQQAAAWSPLGIGDFHVPERFGILTFVGPEGRTLGSNEPAKVSPSRLPASLRREPTDDPRLKRTLIERPAAVRRLESPGGGD